ncbi:hypothetical protein AB6A40_006596 [Gnathostoma spinigerum]|uniref:TBC1 domain family member 13 n=1 Tax=Gnathostoma spinigerum TaxID=75299 RepID=A0ABD6EL05_9BILA
MSEKYRRRITHLEYLLLTDRKDIDCSELREACIYGIPDVFRPLCWRILLGYLPRERNLWPQHLKKQRMNYDALVNDIVVHPGQPTSELNMNNVTDHPLSLNPSSEWNNYFKDNEILAQIDKDVRRLCPEIQFFQRTTNYPHRQAARMNLSKRVRQDNLISKNINYSAYINFFPAPSKVAQVEYSNEVEDQDSEKHWQVVERVLFIYSKLNPGVHYVQGMNELVGPIYYVFANDSDTTWAEFAEADTYYCFQQLMSEIKDNFIRTLDKSNCGIESMMSTFYKRLEGCDSELYATITKKLCIHPQFYAFRWLSLLLSQEFPLPDVIALWDSLFSHTDRLDFLQWICLAMLVNERKRLLMSDFSTSLKLLQNYPVVDVGYLIALATGLKEGRYKVSKNELSDDTSSSNESEKSRNSKERLATIISGTVKHLIRK